MVSQYAPPVRRRRIFARVGVAVGAVAVLGTAVAFNTLFARPGEDALRLIPANALVVGSADLSPSPNQTLVFKKIDDALSRTGLDKKIDGALTDLVAHGPAGEKIRPYAKRGVAFAMLAPEKQSEQFDPGQNAVALFGISDGAEVAKILKQYGKPAFWRGTRFHTLQPEGPGLMVVEDVLVVGMGPALHKVEQVADNKIDSILERPDFVEERAKIDSDANLVLCMAPEAWKTFGKDAPKETAGFLDSQKWMAFGLTVREGGIAISFSGEYDATKAKWLKPFDTMAPLREDLMTVLPKGAYGFAALSQPSKYFESFELAMGQEKDGRKMVSELERDLSKEIGISMRQDVLPAFQGNAIIGFYPSPESNNAAGVDLLVVVDDQNGAKASALAERLRERFEQEMAEEGEESPFVVTKDGDVTRYLLADQMASELQDSLYEEFSGDGTVKADILTKNKTIAFALVGHNVVASSSVKLLNQAIEGLKTQENGLETDPLWKGRSKDLIQGQQTLLTFNIARMVEGFENSINVQKWDENGKTVKEVIDVLKDLKDPFVLKSQTSGSKMSMGLFIPMDYDKLIDLIGRNSD